MTPGQLLLVAAAFIAFALALRRGVLTAQRALRETGETILRVLPLLVAALPMAAFLAELIPPDLAAGWLGPESGLAGIAIAEAFFRRLDPDAIYLAALEGIKKVQYV